MRSTPRALAVPRESVPLSSAGFAGATIPGGRFRKGGEAPLRVERTGSTPRVRPSGAASPLDPFPRPARRPWGGYPHRVVLPSWEATTDSIFLFSRPRSAYIIPSAGSGGAGQGPHNQGDGGRRRNGEKEGGVRWLCDQLQGLQRHAGV